MKSEEIYNKWIEFTEEYQEYFKSNEEQWNDMFAEIKKFKNVLWTISSDTSGDKFNYIRSGGNWNQTLENIKILKSKYDLNKYFDGNIDIQDNFIKNML